MWRHPQDEIGMDGQGKAKEILPTLQDLCIIR
jgi:hypothetical protein